MDFAPSAEAADHLRRLHTHDDAGLIGVTPLAAMWAATRTLRIADGPDAVHIGSVARAELAPYVKH